MSELRQQTTSPAYRRIYTQVCDAIAEGKLRPGDRLPSARSFASQLGLSRGTVDAAYALLAGEGYIVTRGASGTIVSPGLQALAQQHVRPSGPMLRASASARTASSSALPAPFKMGLPALDVFPRTIWSRLTMRRVRRQGAIELSYRDPTGLPELREAISAYLAVSRGIVCLPEQILVTAGFLGALNLIAATILKTGDSVWCEDPGYTMARRALEATGTRIVPVPVDQDGLRVAEGIARAPDAALAVVTPSHQCPLGVSLSLTRRLALLDWADSSKSWIVEDDYDSEYRYVGRLIPALKSLDRLNRVLYVGTFSKTLFPALRLGYLVVPEEQVPAFASACRVLGAARSPLEQAVVADFMAQGHFGRHLKRMRGLYAARRRALADALVSAFGSRISLELQAGGMHLLARFPDQARDIVLERRAARHGLAPTALSSKSVEADCGEGLLLSFTNIAEKNANDMSMRLLRSLDIREASSAHREPVGRKHRFDTVLT